MLQNVDLADGVPMFITVGEREIAVIDAKALRALQDRAALSARPDDSAVERVAAFRDQSCCIAKSGRTVLIECDTGEDANEVLDWLERCAALGGSGPCA